MFVESIVFNSLAMAIGGGVTMVGYSIVIQYIPPQPDYYMFITTGVGVVGGYFAQHRQGGGAEGDLQHQGRRPRGSALSYLFWKERMSRVTSGSRTWFQRRRNRAAQVDPLVCIATMAVCAAAGVFIQNTTAKKDDGRRRTRRSSTRRTPRWGTAPRIRSVGTV